MWYMCICNINFIYSEIIDEAEEGACGDDGDMDDGLMIPLDS